MDQLPFDELPDERPVRIGHAQIRYVDSKSILTRASGFMADYDYTLNPYSGCSFGCTYCYAAFFARDVDRRDTWGSWVDVKENGLAVLRRMKSDLRGKSIYMSSVTDPYQPIERSTGLVRSLLEELLRHQPRLVVQTRSALVTRDIDLFQQFEHVQVNMTVTTDSEAVRKAFEPNSSPIDRRLDAITQMSEAGLESVITMTPLLPVEDATVFARRLVATGVERFVVQPFHADRGRFVAGTRERAVAIQRELGWSDARYRQTVSVLHESLPSLVEGREGFAP